MPAPLDTASRPSPASDLVRLAIPLTVITAAIAATLWIDHGGFAVSHETQAAAPAVSAQALR